MLKDFDQEGYYNLNWCVTFKDVYLHFSDSSFYTPNGDKNVIIKPRYNIPRSVKFEIVDGTPVVIVEWSMYIDGYTGRLETLITNKLTIGTGSFNESYDFKIESYLGEPATNSDFVINP